MSATTTIPVRRSRRRRTPSAPTVAGPSPALTDVDVLQFRDDLPGAGEREVVEQVVGVPAAAPVAHLDEPRPHLVRWSGDGDRPGGEVLGTREQGVTGHRRRDLLGTGPPRTVPTPEQRARRGRAAGRRRRPRPDEADLPRCPRYDGGRSRDEGGVRGATAVFTAPAPRRWLGDGTSALLGRLGQCRGSARPRQGGLVRRSVALLSWVPASPGARRARPRLRACGLPSARAPAALRRRVGRVDVGRPGAAGTRATGTQPTPVSRPSAANRAGSSRRRRGTAG